VTRRRHRAIQITKIAGDLVHLLPGGGAVLDVVPDLPPAEWIVAGPRGGRYAAIGSRDRLVIQVGMDFVTNQWSVIDTAEDTRYIRRGRKP
jgi:hypothetical protein